MILSLWVVLLRLCCPPLFLRLSSSSPLVQRFVMKLKKYPATTRVRDILMEIVKLAFRIVYNLTLLTKWSKIDCIKFLVWLQSLKPMPSDRKQKPFITFFPGLLAAHNYQLIWGRTNIFYGSLIAPRVVHIKFRPWSHKRLCGSRPSGEIKAGCMCSLFPPFPPHGRLKHR